MRNLSELDRHMLANMLAAYGLDAVLHELARQATIQCRETAMTHDTQAAKSWAYAADALEMTAAACAAV